MCMNIHSHIHPWLQGVKRIIDIIWIGRKEGSEDGRKKGIEGERETLTKESCVQINFKNSNYLPAQFIFPPKLYMNVRRNL